MMLLSRGRDMCYDGRTGAVAAAALRLLTCMHGCCATRYGFTRLSNLTPTPALSASIALLPLYTSSIPCPSGTNMYWLALGAHSSATLTEANIDGILATHAANGLRVIRFWGFGEGWRELKVDSKVGWTLHDW